MSIPLSRRGGEDKWIWAAEKKRFWRALSSNLPTMNALRSKRVEVQQWCPNCHQEQEVEDEFHAIVSCTLAKNVWCISSIECDRCRDYNFIAKLVERSNHAGWVHRPRLPMPFNICYAEAFQGNHHGH